MTRSSLLVLELWGVGDLAIATPFLRAASGKFDVTMVAKPYANDLQRRFWPGIRVITFVAPWTAFRRKYRLLSWPWREMFRLGHFLAGERFEVGVSARWDPRDHLLLARARARRRVGFPRGGSEIFLNQPVIRPAFEAHRYEYWRALGGALGLELPRREAIPIPPARPGRILVHSGAGQAVRVWPLDRFRDLVRRLRERGFTVQVACNADQRAWWFASNETTLATPGTIAELLSLIDDAGLFIGNDSGAGHLAALVGVPTFTFFGPQLPERFAPLHPQSEWMEGAFCPHRPCSDYCRFDRPHCLEGLNADSAWLRIEAFVTRHMAQLATTSPNRAPGK